MLTEAVDEFGIPVEKEDEFESLNLSLDKIYDLYMKTVFPKVSKLSRYGNEDIKGFVNTCFDLEANLVSLRDKWHQIDLARK